MGHTSWISIALGFFADKKAVTLHRKAAHTDKKSDIQDKQNIYTMRHIIGKSIRILSTLVQNEANQGEATHPTKS